jgi:hypothetical protein
VRFEEDPPPHTSSNDIQKPTRQYPSFPVSADQLLELLTLFQLNVPLVDAEDIKDRSKADAFTKGFAVLQSAWLVIQCIARRLEGLRETLNFV